MAGTHIQFDVSQMVPVARRIARLGDFDRRELLEGIGAEIESQTRHRFDEETDPQGKRWKPLTAATVLRKLGGSRKVYKKRGGIRKAAQRAFSRLRILQDQGDLVDSIQYIVRSHDVEVGSNLIYAAIHQHGGADAGKPEIPAREYLGISRQNETDLLELINGYLADRLQEAS